MQGRDRLASPGAPWFGLLAAASAGLGMMASVVPSPLLPPLPEGLRPAGWMTRVAEAAGLDRLSPPQATLRASALMGVAVLAFLGLCLAAWRGRISTRAAVVWSLVLIGFATLLPPLLSRDVYSYAMYGRAWAVFDSNPYVLPPIEFKQDPFIHVTSAEWIRTPSVYGPAFTIASGGIVRAFSSESAVVAAFKALAGIALALTVVVGARMGERIAPGRGAFAAVLLGLNPVLLFHAVGGGHNDVLVSLAVVAGLALWRRHPLWATTALTLGALVKLVAVVPLGLAIGAVFLRAGPGLARRVRAAAPHAGLAVAIAGVLSLPFGIRALLDPFAQLTSRLGWASPVRLLTRKMQDLGGSLGGIDVAEGLAALTKGAFTALGVAVLVLILRRVKQSDPRVGAAEAWGWGALVTALCAAYLLPWYVAWFMPALALTRRVTPLALGVAVSSLLAMSAIPAEPSFAPEEWSGMIFAVHYVLAPIVLGLLVALLLDLRRVLTGPAA